MRMRCLRGPREDDGDDRRSWGLWGPLDFDWWPTKLVVMMLVAHWVREMVKTERKNGERIERTERIWERESEIVRWVISQVGSKGEENRERKRCNRDGKNELERVEKWWKWVHRWQGVRRR